MSVSSDSEPPYNAFYDERSVSEGESMDSFIQRQARTKDKSGRRGHKSVKGAAATGEGNGSVLSDLLAPFHSCCLSRNGGSGAPRRFGTGRDEAPLSHFIMQASQLSDDDDSGVSSAGSQTSSSDESNKIALGATPQVLDRRQPNMEYRMRRKGGGASDRQAMQEYGLNWKDFPDTTSLDADARWIIAAPLKESLDMRWADRRNQNENCLTALSWCQKLELSEKLTLHLMERLMREVPDSTLRDMTVPQVIKKSDEYSILEYVRLVEARLIEEVMGEFQTAAASATNSTSSYLIISSGRTVAIGCRQQGEVLLICVFDTGIAQNRGPAFIGFDNAEAAERYVIELYTIDPQVAKVSQKFRAWTLFSKQAYEAGVDSAARKGLEGTTTGKVKPIWDADAAAERPESDSPRHEAKIVYNAMYDATVKPHDQEPIFSHTAAGGIHVKHEKAT